MRIYLFALRVKAGDMVRAGEHHALDAVLSGGLIDVEGADDVGLQNLFEGTLGGDAAQVHDASTSSARANTPALSARSQLMTCSCSPAAAAMG